MTDTGTAAPLAAHTTARVPVVSPERLVGEVRAGLAGRRFDSAALLAVCDPRRRLLGLVTVERLLAAPVDVPVRSVMVADPPTVAPDTDPEEAAWSAIGSGLAGLAVVDRHRRFRGMVTTTGLMEILTGEHHEDLARLGGFLHPGRPARATALESVPRRLWHRLPWLGFGLAGAMLSAALMGAFERSLSELVLIAFFVPGIVYLADAVGTQTETISIRGLPLGISIRAIAARELLTGALIGVLLGGVLLPVVALGWGDVTVAVVVGIATAAASTVATAVGMALPWLLDRLDRDPAFGAGPVATVVQDLLSLGIYLGLAVLLLT